MKYSYLSIAFLISTIFALQGCSMVIRDYKASAKNVTTIKEKYNKSNLKINIQHLEASESGTRQIWCRLERPVRPIIGTTFQEYITNALISELNYAGVYSKTAEINLLISFEEINFYSFVGMGKWVISSTVLNQDTKLFKLKSIYEFSTNSVAMTACAQVSEAFPKAVEIFIDKLISHPEFAYVQNKGVEIFVEDNSIR